MAERATKPVMFVHPDADAPEVQKLLKRAGYVVVVTDSPPEHFRVLPEMPIATAGLLGRVALETIRTGKSFGADDMRRDYAIRVVKALEAIEDFHRAAAK